MKSQTRKGHEGGRNRKKKQIECGADGDRGLAGDGEEERLANEWRTPGMASICTSIIHKARFHRPTAEPAPRPGGCQRWGD